MRTIGLLGGMSWESSVEYERIINREVQRRLGGAHSASLVVISYDFADIARIQREGRWDEAANLLSQGAIRLQQAGAEIVVLCTNQTIHRVIYDELIQGVLNPRSRASFLQIIDRLRSAGAQGIIAGCTEIELLVADGGVCEFAYFPSTRLHALAAVEAALAP